MAYSTGSTSGSTTLTDDDDIYPAHINELRVSNPATYVVGTTTGSQYLVDGTADDVQIQEAIDAANTAGGGIVHLKEGTYDISALITISSNVTLEGEGWTTILKSSANVNIGIIKGTSISNVIIRNLTIDMNRANNTTLNAKQGIFYNTASDSIIEHVYLHDQKHDANTSSSAIAMTNCTNCVCQNNYVATVADYGIISNGAQWCKILNNYVFNPRSHGIAILNGGYGTSYEWPTGNVVTGNIVYYDSTETEGAGGGIKICKLNDSVISNNVLYRGITGYRGIYFDAAGDESDANNKNYCTRVTISNNTIYGFYQGIILGGLIDCTIEGNTIHANSYSSPVGIYITKGPDNAVAVPSTRTNIVNNYMEEATNVVTTGLGISIVNASSSCSIIGNTIYNFGNIGLSLGTGVSDYCNYTQVIDNKIIDSGDYGSSIQGKYCVINNNLFRGSSRTTNNSGDDIHLFYTSTYNTIQGNVIIADGTNKSRYGIIENDANADFNVIARSKIPINKINTLFNAMVGF